MRLALLSVCLIFVGCGQPLPTDDDAGIDSGFNGHGQDSGVPDAGPSDAGPDDGGTASDAGTDAGTADAGADGGFDAGTADAGKDAGVDAGTDVGDAGDGNLVVSTFTTQPELTDLGAPQGKQFTFTMDSTKSIIFDGGDPTLNPAKPRSLTRQINVYVPAKYVNGTKAPILVIQDGAGPFTEIRNALDNLTISTNLARRIPPFIAIAVQNGGDDSFGSERGLEYDTMSDRYARFIQTEVLPAVLSNPAIKAAYPNIAITDDPEGRATYGCSSGAAAAYTMAWFRPDLFRRVISYSGTFVAQQNAGQPESPIYPLGAWEYHSSQQLIANAARKPLRVFLNVNEFDNGYNAPESGHHNWVMANDRMAAALFAKNYHYRYVLAKTLGHCDGKAVKATLADTLVWLWRGYP